MKVSLKPTLSFMDVRFQVWEVELVTEGLIIPCTAGQVCVANVRFFKVPGSQYHSVLYELGRLVTV